jgi:hypothetical protein
MRTKIKSRIAVMSLLVLFLFGSAAATASAPQGDNCRARCNEVFRSHLAACRNLPRGERRVCEARAKSAHHHCLRRCRNL